MNQRFLSFCALCTFTLIFAGAGCTNSSENTIAANQSISNEQTVAQEKQIEVTLSSDKPELRTYTVSVLEGSTVERVMEEAQTQGFLYETKTMEGLGSFVTSIHGVNQNEAENEYWSLYINDELAQEGMSTQKVNATDRIQWKLEKVSF